MNRFKTRKKSAKDYNSNYANSASSLVSTSFTKAFKKGKKNQTVAQEHSPAAIDLQNALPSDDNLRTSLLLPNLSARFSMLREQNDPRSMLGKANDDSVLEPKRASKLNFLNTSHPALFDISEASSTKAVMSFGPHEDMLANIENENPDRSIMDRPRPLEGNVLFGGRQKVYRVAESSDPLRPQVLSKPLCEMHDIALHNEFRNTEDESTKEEGAEAVQDDAARWRNHKDTPVHHQNADWAPEFPDPPKPQELSTSFDMHDVHHVAKHEYNGGSKDQNAEAVQHDTTKSSPDATPVSHRSYSSAKCSRTSNSSVSDVSPQPQAKPTPKTDATGTDVLRQPQAKPTPKTDATDTDVPRQPQAKPTPKTDATDTDVPRQPQAKPTPKNVTGTDVAQPFSAVASPPEEPSKPNSIGTRKPYAAGVIPQNNVSSILSKFQNLDSANANKVKRPVALKPRSNPVSNLGNRVRENSDISKPPATQQSSHTSQTNASTPKAPARQPSSPTSQADTPVSKTTPNQPPLHTSQTDASKPRSSAVPQKGNQVRESLDNSQTPASQSSSHISQTEASKARSSPVSRNGSHVSDSLDDCKAPETSPPSHSAQTDASVSSSALPSHDDKAMMTKHVSPSTVTESITNPQFNIVEETSEKSAAAAAAASKPDEPQTPPRNRARAGSAGQSRMKQLLSRHPTSGIRRGSQSLRSPVSEPQLTPPKEDVTKSLLPFPDPFRSNKLSTKEVSNDRNHFLALKPAPLNLTSNRDAPEPRLGQNNRSQPQAAIAGNHLQPPSRHRSRENKTTEKPESASQEGMTQASISAANWAGLMLMKDDSEGTILPPNPPSPNLEGHSVDSRSVNSDSTKANPGSIDGQSQHDEAVDQSLGIFTPTSASEVSLTPPTRSPSRTPILDTKHLSDQAKALKQGQQEKQSDQEESLLASGSPIQPNSRGSNMSRHCRMESVEAQIEREDFSSDLAERRKIVQEKLRTVAEARSRSNSPAPGMRNTDRGASGLTSMLKSKSQKTSGISRDNSPHRGISRFLGNDSSVTISANTDARTVSSRSRSSSIVSKRGAPAQDPMPSNHRDTHNALQPPVAFPYTRGRAGSELSRARNPAPVANERPTTGRSPRSFQRPSYESTSGNSSTGDSSPLSKKSHSRLRGNSGSAGSSGSANRSVSSFTSVPAQQPHTGSATFSSFASRSGPATPKRPVNKSQISEPVLISSTGHIGAGISSSSSNNLSSTPRRLRTQTSVNSTLEPFNNNSNSSSPVLIHPPTHTTGVEADHRAKEQRPHLLRKESSETSIKNRRPLHSRSHNAT